MTSETMRSGRKTERSSIRHASVFGLMPTLVPFTRIWLVSIEALSAALSARSLKVTLQSVFSLHSKL